MKPFPFFTLFLLFLVLSCSNEQTKSDNVSHSDPIELFMTQIGDKKYNNLDIYFSNDLSNFWNETSFSKEIKNIREKIGNTWSPEETNSMNWNTQKGRVKQKTFRLQKKYKQTFTFSFVSRKIDGKEKIVRLNATAPYKQKIPTGALSVSNEFLSYIVKTKYSKARNIVIPPIQPKFTDDLFKTLRKILILPDGSKSKVTIKGHRTLLNGVWYETIIYNVDDAFMKYISIYLSLVNGKYSVMAVDFKNYNKFNK